MFFLDPRFLLRRLISDAEAVCAFKETAPNPVVIPEKRIIELDEPTLRIAVGKDDSHKKLWRFTVKGKKVSK